MSNLSDEIYIHFVTNDFKWLMDGQLREPTREDIEKVISHAKTALDGLDDNEVQLEVGRLLFKKREGVIDVYGLFGEI